MQFYLIAPFQVKGHRSVQLPFKWGIYFISRDPVSSNQMTKSTLLLYKLH